MLYLQLSRFLLKSYKRVTTKKAELDNSVKYLAQFDQLLKSRVAVPANDHWRLSDVDLLLKQCVCFMITIVNEVLAKNEAISSKDTKNTRAALRLVQLAQLHSLLFYFDGFHQTVGKYNDCPAVKAVLEQVCLLFGVNALLGKAFILAESGIIPPEGLSSLERCKEGLLRVLRPEAATLIQAIGLPDSTIRSLVVKGDIYEVTFL